MKRATAAAGLLLLLGAVPRASAQDFQLHGYLDLRLQAATADDRSWTDGGLAKGRWGEETARALQPGAGALAVRWQVTPALVAVVDLQLHPQTSPRLGILEAYLRLRPVSTTPWRWSLRAGAFFPPISLENDAVGWTSPWTLTPSAIDSWVGEELRTIGAEGRLERRGARGTLELGLAGFRHNDPAGELLASRGWAMGDVTSALGSRLREPDVLASTVFSPAPLGFRPFVENDGRVGVHADLSWRSAGGARATLLRYDNRADPASFAGEPGGRRVFSWHTRFWSLGAELPLALPVGELVLLAQLMDGTTAFEPVPALYLATDLHAGYLLAGWERDAWRLALRFDAFALRQGPEWLPAPLSEHGSAWTAALTWRPERWLRVSGEVVRIASTRDQRRLAGLAPRQVETVPQLAVRLLF